MIEFEMTKHGTVEQAEGSYGGYDGSNKGGLSVDASTDLDSRWRHSGTGSGFIHRRQEDEVWAAAEGVGET